MEKIESVKRVDLKDAAARAEQAVKALRRAADDIKAEFDGVADELRQYQKIDLDELRRFMAEPWCILPKSRTEWWVVIPRWIGLSVGYLERATDTYNIFRVDRYSHWFGTVPGELREQLKLPDPFDAVVDGNELRTTAKLPENVRRHVAETLGEGRFRITRGHEFDILAALVEAGSLPFKPKPVAAEDLRDVKLQGLLAKPRDYQLDAWKRFLETGAVLVCWPFGMGKTFLGLYAIAYLKGPKLIVVPSTTLVEQWEERLQKCLDLGLRVDVQVVTYYAWEKVKDKDWTLVIFDEAHRLPASTFSRLSMLRTKYRVGLSVGGDSRILVDGPENVRHMTIEDFAEKVGAIDDIFVPVSGYRIRSFDGQKFVWKDLTAVLRHRLGNKKAFRIGTEKGRTILVTEDHSLYVIRESGFVWKQNKKKPIGVVEEIKGGELRPGDYVLLEDEVDIEVPVRSFDMTATMTGENWFVAGQYEGWIKENVTIAQGFPRAARARYRRLNGRHGAYVTAAEFRSFPDLRLSGGKIYTEGARDTWVSTKVSVEAISYLIGFYLGNGWISENRLGFAVNNKKLDRFLEGLGRLGPYAEIHPETRAMAGQSVEIRIANRVLKDFFQAITHGAKAAYKRIPQMVFAFDRKAVLEVVRGMMDSDGHLSEMDRGRARWYYTTTSRGLADDLCELLKRVGVVASVAMRSAASVGGMVRGRRIIGRHPSYVVHFSDWALRGDNSGRKGHRSHFEMNGVRGYPVKVVKIEQEPAEFVYDLSVAPHAWPSFVASGILVHNSATPYREDGRENFVVALSGFPVGVDWTEFVRRGLIKKPDIEVRIVSGEGEKIRIAEAEAKAAKGTAIVFCDGLDFGARIAARLKCPHIHGETDDRLKTIAGSKIAVVSRVGDEGLSVPTLTKTIEVDFLGSSRRQESQRVGRLLHGEKKGEHLCLMTRDEFEKFENRFLALEEKGFKVTVRERS